jgi:carboxymethylenebutenolidase
VASRSIDIPSRDGKSFKGYLSLPPTGTGPGILLIQEIFGVNRHIRAVADQYAMDGYVVLAPDMFWRTEPGLELGYGEGDMRKGMEMKQKTDLALVAQDMASTVETLRALPECTGKVASIGYCMGGLVSYLAAANAGVDAAVCYYPGGIEGQLAQAEHIKCPILFHFASKDRIISESAVTAVRNTFAGRPDAAVELHRDVDHGFNCWDRASYNQKAAALAHGMTLTFIARQL